MDLPGACATNFHCSVFADAMDKLNNISDDIIKNTSWQTVSAFHLN